MNNNSPTQANLSAIVISNQRENGFQDGVVMGERNDLIGVVDNSNILPLSLNESRVHSGAVSQGSN